MVGESMSEGAMDLLRDRKTLSDLVVAELRERIASGRMAMGAEVNQVALTSELGVSRAAVREAFRQLEASGLIRLTPHHHAVVNVLRESQIWDLMAVRLSVETLAVSRVVPESVTAEEIGDLRRLLRAMASERRQEEWLTLDRTFHLALCGLGRNPFLCNLLESLRLPIERYVRAQVRVVPQWEVNNAQHERIVAALAARDVPLAVKILRQHIRARQKRLEAVLHGPAATAKAN